MYKDPNKHVSAFHNDPTPDVGTTDIPFDTPWCPICSHQIIPKHILVPIKPCPTPPTLLQAVGTHKHCSTAIAFLFTTHPHLQNRVGSNEVIKGSPTQDTTLGTPSGGIPAVKPPRACHYIVINQTSAPLYCSDACHLADLYPKGVKCSSGASYTFLLSPPSVAATATTTATAKMSPPNSGVNAYLHLSAMYSFAPLLPPPPFTPKVTASAEKPPPPFDGGIILVARHIKAALCNKTTKSFWGNSIPSDPSEDNKPIPGWTDGSNTWHASVYGFTPLRNFTCTDSDYAAICAYGSYVTSPYRSHGVHSTLGKDKHTAMVNNDDLQSSLQFIAAQTDATTHKLYNQYSAAFAQHSQSCHLSLHTGPLRSCSTYEVLLLKPGAEGHLLVPEVKMCRRHHKVAGVGGCFHQQSCDNCNNKLNTAHKATNSLPAVKMAKPLPHMQSYSSEVLMYPIMRIAPKKEMRVEHQLINGVECEIMVEVLVENPIK
ncbi:hypothetical protein V8D89_016253 [Ganoderma adspersum]